MTARTRHARTAATPDWSAGRCSQTDPDLFFAEGKGAQVTTKTRDAKKVCAACPIRSGCLDWALATQQPAGVWGGLDWNERREFLGIEKTQTEICWEQQDLIQERLASGTSVKRIAAEVGVAPISVSRFIAQYDSENSTGAIGVAA